MIKWTTNAQNDMLDIGHYIARDNPRAARLHLEKIRERIRNAAKSPLTLRVVPEYSMYQIREAIVGNYRVICKVIGKNDLEVLAVFEGHRQLKINIDLEL